MVHLHLRLQTAGERRAELVAFLRDATPFYTAPGGIRLRLLERRGTPNEFLEIIEYDTNEHFLVDQTRVEDDPHMIGMPDLKARDRSRPIASASAIAEPPALPSVMNTSNG